LSDESAITAIVFDLDGVIVDSESIWNRARAQLVADRGGTWRDDAQRAMMGMSSTEWSQYMHDELGVDLSPPEISSTVVARLQELYRQQVPVIPGAAEAVRALAEHYPLGLASSANREIIDLVLDLTGLAEQFRVTVSSEEVSNGKPAPDVYLEAAKRLHVDPHSCAAVEDSANGLRAAAAAGMTVIAFPNRDFPPPADALALADQVLGSLDDLRPGEGALRA
jgi:HAD superfamily hydrolase (TIGR01509 family)